MPSSGVPQLVVPAFIAGETCYMLQREGGSAAEAEFLRSLRAGKPFLFEGLLPEDLERIAPKRGESRILRDARQCSAMW